MEYLWDCLLKFTQTLLYNYANAQLLPNFIQDRVVFK